MIFSQAIAPQGQLLDEQQIHSTFKQGLEGRFARQKLLVLIPDHTRSLPLPFLFRLLVEILADTRQLDFMVALGTHPALPEESLNELVGITAEERSQQYRHVRLLNHAWQEASALTTLGTMEADEIKAIAGEHWHPPCRGGLRCASTQPRSTMTRS